MKKFMKKNEKGFTLAELLIVVAIIAVLVAISIPIFTTRLESSREAVDASNLRAAYAVAQAEALTNPPEGETEVTTYYDASTGALVAEANATACGKGTKVETTTTFDLPSVCTYTSATPVAGMIIEVKYKNTGATSVQFVSAS